MKSSLHPNRFWTGARQVRCILQPEKKHSEKNAKHITPPIYISGERETRTTFRVTDVV